MTEEEIKTPDEWCEQLGFKILDPDGWRWDFGDIKPRTYEDPIGRHEFEQRAMRSTMYRE